MNSDDVLDLAIITVLLNEARKCLDIINGANEEDEDRPCDSVRNLERRAIKQDEADDDDNNDDDEVNDEVDDDDDLLYADLDYDLPDKMFDLYVDKLCYNDPEVFKENTTISMNAFKILYDLVKRDVRRISQRRPVSPKCRLFITLVYLSNGGYKKTLSCMFAMPSSTLNKVVTQTCQALWKCLSKTYFGKKTRSDWQAISQQFESEYNVPHCVGAVDLRIIQLRCAHKNKLRFYQKKGKYSFTIFGACDANYQFTGIDVAVYERNNEESSVWSTGFEKKLIKGELNLPYDEFLPNSRIRFPYYFVGDSSCPLKTNLMQTYPAKTSANHTVFNSHMTRVYQLIDNTFGVMAARWKILSSPLIMNPEKMELVLKATVLLHNFAIAHDSTYMPFGYVDRYEGKKLIRGDWRNEVSALLKPRKLYANNSAKTCYQARDKLSAYLKSNAPDDPIMEADSNDEIAANSDDIIEPDSDAKIEADEDNKIDPDSDAISEAASDKDMLPEPEVIMNMESY